MRTILLVDDEEIFVNVLRDTLQKEPAFQDFQIFTAYDGAEALKILMKQPVDLVISDIRMPKLDGLEMLAILHRAKPEVPVFIITAFGTPELQSKALEIGAVQYIQKPVDMNALIEKIKSFFNSSASGFIQGISLPDFLQVITLSQKTCSLNVRSRISQGKLYFSQGQILHAETETLKGIDAALEILGWDNVEIEIGTLPANTPQTIQMAVDALLMEALRLKDERLRNAAKETQGLFLEDLDIDVDEITASTEVVPPHIEGNGNGDDFVFSNVFKEGVIAMKQEQIDKILEKLSGIEGSYGGTIVSRDGMVIASRVDKRFANDKIAALASEAVKVCNRVIQEAHFGEPQNMIIEGTDGKMCIVYTGKGGIFMNVLGSKDLSLGMARIVLDEAAEEFKDLV